MYGCLYTSLTKTGAIAEYRKVLARLGLRPEAQEPRDLTSVLVVVEPVLDLTDAAVIKRLRVDAAAILRDDDEALELCRLISDIARAEGYSAVLSPSVAAHGARNLNIYIDTPPSQLQLSPGAKREPLNY